MENVKFISNNKNLLRKVINLDEVRQFMKCSTEFSNVMSTLRLGVGKIFALLDLPQDDYRNYYLEQKVQKTRDTESLIKMLDFIQENLENNYELYLESKEEYYSITDFLELMAMVDLDNAYNIKWNEQMQEFEFNIDSVGRYKLGVL